VESWEWIGAAGAALAGPLRAAALVWFAVCCAVLVRTDLREHRLPNRWTLRLLLGGLVGMAGAALLEGRPDAALAGVCGGLGYAGAMLVLHIVSRGGLGMGDVKLAAGLGVYTGEAGGAVAVLAAGVGAVLLGGITAAGLVLLRRACGSTALPFGPALVGAAVASLALA